MQATAADNDAMSCVASIATANCIVDTQLKYSVIHTCMYLYIILISNHLKVVHGSGRPVGRVGSGPVSYTHLTLPTIYSV